MQKNNIAVARIHIIYYFNILIEEGFDGIDSIIGIMSIKTLIVDDHKLFRDGLKALLEKHQDIEIIGEAENGIGAVSLAGKLKPDIILMDISMPELNGIEATRKILAENKAAIVIILSMHFNRRYIIESLRAGALAYLLKDSAIEEILIAIRAALNRKIYLSNQITDLVIKDYIDLADTDEPSAYSLLSPREREVLQLLAEGKGTKEIAAKLNVSVKTIETHRKRIMNRLNIHSIAELTKYAIKEGLTNLE